jgi:hypothetical protein
MATHIQIINTLKRLDHAYRRKPPPEDIVRLYIQHLGDIPIQVLNEAVQEHILDSEWYPRISQLRLRAAKIVGLEKFDSRVICLQDPMIVEARRLVDLFFQDGHLDPAEWNALADKFDDQDLPYRAEHTRQRLAAYQQIDNYD